MRGITSEGERARNKERETQVKRDYEREGGRVRERVISLVEENKRE